MKKGASVLVTRGTHQGLATVLHDAGALIRVRFDALTEPCHECKQTQVPIERWAFREYVKSAQEQMVGWDGS